MNEQDIEQEIQAKGLTTAPRVTPDDVAANIVNETYFTGADALTGQYASDTQALANKLMAWPVPADVYPDGTPGQPGRTGTNLMTQAQAAGMFADILSVDTPTTAIARMTVCVLTLRNGFTVTGINYGPVSAPNFDAELGKKLARAQAVNQIWPLMGYALAERLHNTPAASTEPIEHHSV